MLTDERTAGPDPSDAPRTRLRGALAPVGTLPLAVVLIGAAAGLAVRIAVLHGSVGALDSDEAVVGLMARQFLDGHYRAFYWGQLYGGTIEVGLSAIGFKLFGASTIVLKAVPLILSGCAALLTWRVGRRVTSGGAAQVAGLLVWLWPANYLWWSIKARGFYQATLCLGLAALLLALRAGQGQPAGKVRAATQGQPSGDERRGGRWTDWALLGLVSGLGWWQSPQIGFFLVPAAIWLVWTLRTGAWRFVIAIPPALIGAAPWVVANLQSHFASFSPPPAPVKGGYLDHLSVFGREGLPMTFGLKVIYSSRWVHPSALMAVAYVAIIAAIVAGCIKRWPGGWVIVAMLVSFPLLHALLSLAGTVAEGRYTLFVLPAVALALAHWADRRLTAGLLVAGCLGITAVGALSLRGNTAPYFSNRKVPASLTSLERALQAHGTTRVWSNYWVAYRVTFETGERVVAAPVAVSRDAAITSLVAGAVPPAAHVFLAGTREDVAFRKGLLSRHVQFASYSVGERWTVYLPTTPVGPLTIAGSAP